MGLIRKFYKSLNKSITVKLQSLFSGLGKLTAIAALSCTALAQSDFLADFKRIDCSSNCNNASVKLDIHASDKYVIWREISKADDILIESLRARDIETGNTFFLGPSYGPKIGDGPLLYDINIEGSNVAWMNETYGFDSYFTWNPSKDLQVVNVQERYIKNLHLNEGRTAYLSEGIVKVHYADGSQRSFGNNLESLLGINSQFIYGVHMNEYETASLTRLNLETGFEDEIYAYSENITSLKSFVSENERFALVTEENPLLGNQEFSLIYGFWRGGRDHTRLIKRMEWGRKLSLSQGVVYWNEKDEACNVYRLHMWSPIKGETILTGPGLTNTEALEFAVCNNKVYYGDRTTVFEATLKEVTPRNPRLEIKMSPKDDQFVNITAHGLVQGRVYTLQSKKSLNSTWEDEEDTVTNYPISNDNTITFEAYIGGEPNKFYQVIVTP